MAAENPINKRRVNPGLTLCPVPSPSAAWFSPTRDSLLDDDTLVGAYRTDLCLHQDRSATTIATYVHHLGAFRRWLADHYPDTVAARGPRRSTSRRTCWPRLAGASPPPLGPRPFSRCAPSTSTCAPRTSSTPIRRPRSGSPVPASCAPRSTPTPRPTRSWPGRASQPKRRWRVGYVVLATLRWTGLRRNEIAMLRSTRWTSTPGASRSSARGTRPASCPSLPRSFPSSTTI